MTPPSRPILCAGLALLAGCGSSDEEPTGPPTRVAAGEEVRLIAREYKFDPARLVVPVAQGKVRFTLSNDGALAHDIAIRKGDEILGATPSFQRGGERSVEVALKPGSYTYVCTVGDHEDLGMRGELTVR